MSGSGAPLTPAGIATIPVPQVGAAQKTDPDQQAFVHQVDTDLAEEKLAGMRQDRTERKTYAGRIFYLICGWLLFVGFIILLSGFCGSSPTLSLKFARPIPLEMEMTTGFKLSDAVLLAIVGSTTATVLGLFVIVANYLFPKPKD